MSISVLTNSKEISLKQQEITEKQAWQAPQLTILNIDETTDSADNSGTDGPASRYS